VVISAKGIKGRSLFVFEIFTFNGRNESKVLFGGRITGDIKAQKNNRPGGQKRF
jgi:hypothetical protein